MQHKKYALWVLISLVYFFLNACTAIQSSNSAMPKDKKAKLYLQMGVRYLEMDKLIIAKEKLDSALALDSNNKEIHNVLGVLHERLKQYDIARLHYQHAMTLDSQNAGIKNNYGRFLCERGEYEQGENLLEQALADPLNNRRWFAYTNLGRCELTAGNQQKAENNFRQALQENRRYSPALLEMQKVSYRKGKFMSARGFLERYLAVAKHTAATLWYAVQTERSLGNQQLAEEYREQLFNLFPVSKEARQLKPVIR